MHLVHKKRAAERRVERRLVLHVLGFAVLSCFALSCDSSRTPGQSASGGTVVIGLLSDPKTLNPLVATSIESRTITDLLFLKLLEEQSDFVNFEPELAERWNYSDDSLSITFFLREDVVWENGEPFTADDVRFTWELQIDTLVAWPSSSVKERVVDVEVVNEHAVTFHFARRYPYQLMDANDGVILPRHALEHVPRERFRTSDFGRHPIGNGPFKLARWESEQFVELQRNPLYHERGMPHLEKVVFRTVPDMTTLVTQLKSGEIDCLESLPVDAVADIRTNHPEVRIYTYTSRQLVYVAWNLGRSLFGSREIRRALAMAVDSDEMIRTLWGGMAQASDSPMHPILWAHDPSMAPVPYDPEGARAVLAENGWVDSDGDGVLEKGGERFEFEMIANQGNQLRADVMTMIQEYMRRVGIRVIPRTFEWNTFVEKVVAGDFESCVLGWKTGTRADLTDVWRSTSTPPAGYNIARYNRAAVDSLIDLAKNSPDIRTARPLWYGCQKLIFDDYPVLFVAVPCEVVGLRSRFCDVKPNAIGFFVNLPQWYVGDRCP